MAESTSALQRIGAALFRAIPGKMRFVFLTLLVAVAGTTQALAGSVEAREDYSLDAPILAQASEDADGAPAAADGGIFTGFVEARGAYTYASPAHWSKGLGRLELAREGKFRAGLKYKISGRFDYDVVYDSSNFYPHDVRADMRREFQVRETYLDATAGDWEFRLGRQHIVWGEMLGLFFADVVSAKDQREFILPEFDAIRIPQWAARAEYFKDDFHTELIWIPYATYDEVGKPGAEFYPLTATSGRALNVRGDEQPSHSLRNSNFGVRFGTIKNGWDVAGFAYRSMDASPVFAYDSSLSAYRPQHDRITQVGATLAKDFGSVVLKSEAVYTRGRRYATTDSAVASGLIYQNTFNFVVGLEFALPADINLNVEIYDNVTLDRDPNLYFSAHEAGTGVLLRRDFGSNVEAQAMYLRSLNRDDWMLSPSVKWGFAKNWKLKFGADIFNGPPAGAFGRFRNRDRIYSDLRYYF